MPSLFSQKSYRAFLEAWIQEQPKRGRGVKLRLSKQIGVQPSFFTSVLKGRMHFSLDQAFDLATSMGLADAERKLFLLLLQRERAGTPALRKHFDAEIEEERKRSQNLARRLEGAMILDEAGMQEYFSSWAYAAVHLACLIEPFETMEAISARLGLERKTVIEILWKLEDMGMIQKGKKGFESGKTKLHLPKESLHLKQHQMNLKAKSLDMVQKGAEGMQYISLVSISKADFHRIYEELVQTLNRTRPIIDESAAEDLYIFNIDLARLI